MQAGYWRPQTRQSHLHVTTTSFKLDCTSCSNRETPARLSMCIMNSSCAQLFSNVNLMLTLSHSLSPGVSSSLQYWTNAMNDACEHAQKKFEFAIPATEASLRLFQVPWLIRWSAQSCASGCKKCESAQKCVACFFGFFLEKGKKKILKIY